MARAKLTVEPGLLAEELRGFIRTVAEIEWLLLILVLLYQVQFGGDKESSAAVLMALFFYAAFIMSFHYIHFYRQKTRWHLAIETWVMIVFITWVLNYTGRLESPLVNLYLLVIITSALSLGKLITLLEVGVIASCYLFLASTSVGHESCIRWRMSASSARNSRPFCWWPTSRPCCHPIRAARCPASNCSRRPTS